MPTTTTVPATDRQLEFLRSLALEREIDQDHRDQLLARIEARQISKAKASSFIERLLEKPRVRAASVQLPDVPAGRYAVDSAEGELRFYRVARGKTGRTWIHVQHGPDESEVPFSWIGYTAILESIVDAGLAEAMQRYGHEIGSCGNCGLRLTNRVSRELGIGPVCGGRMFEDAWRPMERGARQAIVARGEDPDEEVA